VLAERVLEIRPLPPLVFGVGAVTSLGERVRAIGERAIVVTDRGVAGAGVAAAVVASLEASGLPSVIFDGVHANPVPGDVLAALGALHDLGPVAGTVVVGLGGGSPMDTAKSLAMLATNPAGRDVAAVRALESQVRVDALAVVCVPTTSGTGSETNDFGVLTDPELGAKVYPWHASALPRLALLDPALTAGVPAGATANTGMDALTHAVEAISSRNRNEYADGLCLQVAHLVRRWLPVAVADGADLEARSQLAMASHLAGVAMATGTGQGACHGIGHALSTRLGVAHGAGLAVLLPEVMRFNLPACTPVYARLAFALGVGQIGAPDGHNAHAAIDAVAALSATVGTARRLAEFGLDDTSAEVIAHDCLADAVTRNAPVLPTVDDVRALIAACR